MKTKEKKKTEARIKDMWDIVRVIYVKLASQKEIIQKDQAILEEVMVKNFPKLI